MATFTRTERLRRRHRSIRKKIFGTPERPRLFVRRSARHMTVSLIDDIEGRTLVTLTTNQKDFTGKKPESKLSQAQRLGGMVAEKAKELGIESVVFDRGGHPYHGRVKALADKAREGGLKF
jgi:large subunit ribosomal protein L18